MKKIVLGMVLGMFALSMAGCGNPSKSDVCGDCGEGVKDLCETAYDVCDDNGDCLDALEDGYGKTC
jgi:hypothetical protein